MKKIKHREFIYSFILFTLCLIHILTSIFNIPFNDLVSKYSFYLLVVLGLLLVIYVSKKTVSNWLTVSINPELMPLVRGLYGIACLYSALQHFTLVPYGIEPYNFLVWNIKTPNILVYLIYTIHLLAIILIILGYKLRLSWIVLFITGGVVIPFSLEIFVKNIFNFYAMFIPVHIWCGVNDEKTKTYDGWPLLLMVISYGILMSTAGFFKLLDPVWQKGLGLYYSLNIPFFTPKYLWWILDNELLIKGLNWLTLIFELLSLPLLLFRKTRIYGMITLLGLGFFLTFIMEGIGVMGGPIILIACIAVLGLTKYPTLLKKYIPKFSYFKINRVNKMNKEFNPFWLSIVVFWWTLTGFYSNFYNHAIGSINYYPPKYGNFTINSAPLINNNHSFLVRLRYVNNVLKALRPPSAWEFVWTLELFDYHHLFDRVYFRVLLIDEKGLLYEPIKFFENDGAISWNQPLPGNEKFLLTAFRIMDDVRTNRFKKTNILSDPLSKELTGLIIYCKDKSSNNGNDIKFGKVQIKQVLQPFEYKGNFKTWKNSEWLDFYFYNISSEDGKCEVDLPIFDYSKLKIDAFRNEIIQPNF